MTIVQAKVAQKEGVLGRTCGFVPAFAGEPELVIGPTIGVGVLSRRNAVVVNLSQH